MAIITRIANKTKFETGDVPSQNDFIDLLDSVFMLGSDTLENIPQGTNQKWVTPTQINTWDSKANATHTHSIANVTGLSAALDQKIQFVNPTYFSAGDLSTLGTIPLNAGLSNVSGECPAGGFAVSMGDVSAGFVAERYTGNFTNNTGGAVNIQIQFEFVDAGNPAGYPKTAANTVLNIADGERLVWDGTFVANSGGGFYFVGILNSKPI